jgi:hypothetical protein
MRRAISLVVAAVAMTVQAEETATPAATPAPATATVAPRLATVAGPLQARPDSALVGEDAAAPLPATLRENSYFYGSFGTRDPFRSLLAGDFEPRLQELVDLHTVTLVGVVWEPDEIMAMVQDTQGFGYSLRPGDAVKNGVVTSITPDAVSARLNVFGQTTQLTLRLQHEE